MSAHPDIATVNSLLADQMADLAPELAGEPTGRSRRELRFRRKGSLAVIIGGPERGCWYDHEAGCGGDPLGLIAHLLAIPMRDAFAWALRWLGVTPREWYASAAALPRPAPRPRGPSRGGIDERARWSAGKARRMWTEAVEPAGTLVESYLASRGLALPEDAPLRFHPGAWRNWKNGPHSPAMVASMTDAATGAWVGTHITYLRPDGTGKAGGHGSKIKLGNAGVIRLVPDGAVTLGLGIAEGIETALMVMQRYDWRPVWAAGDAGGIRCFPVLAGVDALTVWADADDGGACLRAAEECLARWWAAGQEAYVAPAPSGTDFADLGGTAA